ncbi:hypothetical protein NDU88_005791 [Pleurodeles waltl]|uniref:Uncharacterized protein n=1 Tax=Pleurodeles waltl TaxID=8319 RepID=A0AAV7UM29_PLEWA|nr:hypothetical protein NDU88_005791 [Pleurodeles waltl]
MDGNTISTPDSVAWAMLAREAAASNSSSALARDSNPGPGVRPSTALPKSGPAKVLSGPKLQWQGAQAPRCPQGPLKVGGRRRQSTKPEAASSTLVRISACHGPGSAAEAHLRHPRSKAAQAPEHTPLLSPATSGPKPGPRLQVLTSIGATSCPSSISHCVRPRRRASSPPASQQGPSRVPAAAPPPRHNLLCNCAALPAVGQGQEGSRRSTG